MTTEDRAAVVQELLELDFRVQRDGSYTETVHSVMRPTNSGTAEQLRSLPLRFLHPLETLELIEAKLFGTDGLHLAANCADIAPAICAGAPQVPMFNILRQKTVRWQKLSIGDTLSLSYRRNCLEALVDGHFTLHREFPTTVDWRNVKITIEAPTEMRLLVSRNRFSECRSAISSESVLYTWIYDGVPGREPAATGNEDIPCVRPPSIRVTSFADYRVFSGSIAEKFEGGACRSDAVNSIARALGKSACSPWERVESAYTWVLDNIQLLGLKFGCRALRPHGHELVIANGYGDSLDVTSLLVALLRELEIVAEPVLVTGAPDLVVTDLPIFSDWDHTALWLPELHSYLDVTRGVPARHHGEDGRYGCAAIHVSSGRDPSRQLVAGTGEVASRIRISTRGYVEENGSISGTTRMSASGALSQIAAEAARMMIASGVDNAIASQLVYFGWEGRGDLKLSTVQTNNPAQTVLGSFSCTREKAAVAREGFTLPVGISPVGRPIEAIVRMLLAELNGVKLPVSVEGANVTEDVEWKLPCAANALVAYTPMLVEDDVFSFRSHWLVMDRMVTVRRELRVAQLQAGLNAIHTITELLSRLKSDYLTCVELAPEVMH